MKKEIVYTDNYLLVVDNLSRPAKEGETFLSKEGFIHTNTGYNYGDKLIIAHLPLSDTPIIEGVPLLPSFRWSQQDDVNKLAYEQWKKPDYRSGNPPYIYGIGFYEGYNKAKEKYKYTEEDLIAFGWKCKEKSLTDVKLLSENFIQSLQQPSRPTHFDCEMENCDKCVYVQGGNLSPDCCNQLKPKTITNSQGYIELVGKYLNL